MLEKIGDRVNLDQGVRKIKWEWGGTLWELETEDGRCNFELVSQNECM